MNNKVLKSSSYCFAGVLGGVCVGLGYLYYTKKMDFKDLKSTESYLCKPVYVGGLVGLTLSLGLQYNWTTLLKNTTNEEKN